MRVGITNYVTSSFESELWQIMQLEKCVGQIVWLNQTEWKTPGNDIPLTAIASGALDSTLELWVVSDHRKQHFNFSHIIKTQPQVRYG